MRIKFKKDIELTVDYRNDGKDVEIFHENEEFEVAIRITFLDGATAYIEENILQDVEFLP